MNPIRMLSGREVRLTDHHVENSFCLERRYLLSLRPDRLLAPFRETAGLAGSASPYGGWERLEIRGHTMGHWLSAMAQAWSYTGEELFLERIREAIVGLASCQRQDGFLFGSPEALFDRVERGEEAWVPWYTMHKILAGLLAVAELTPCDEAETLLRKLADYCCHRVLSWSEPMCWQVLKVEYGGMSDVLYCLFARWREPRLAKAAHRFDEERLCDSLARGEDVLEDLHANTTIPKVLGFARRYAVLGGTEERYLQAAECFWEMVVGQHSYVTLGNSEWEHFGPAGVLDAERTEYNCETCNVYNMLKLSQLLFCLTGKKRYADFDAWAYVNSILASQNHSNGMTTYFQPMASGYFKVYSRPEDDFWCCTGTGMENFTKPWAGLAFSDGETLFLNRLLACEIETEGLSLSLSADWLHSDELELRVKSCPKGRIIKLRVPDWTQTPESLPVPFHYEKGYLVFAGESLLGKSMRVSYPKGLRRHGLPDNPRVYAYSFGPFVLSGAYPGGKLRTGKTGVNVTVATREGSVRDRLIDPVFLPGGEACSFRVRSADGWESVFRPHFLKNTERYGLYYEVAESDDSR